MTKLEQERTERLTLRDQIALSVLSQVESDSGTIEDAAKELGIKVNEYKFQIHWPILAARRCYSYADAFLKEREVSQTKTTNDTEEPELWRDLKEGEVYQNEDRVCLHNQKWVSISAAHFYIGMRVSKDDVLAQRRVRKEDL